VPLHVFRRPSRFSGHPFDLTKTRLQTAAPGAYTGALDVVKKTIARDGVSGYVLRRRARGNPAHMHLQAVSRHGSTVVGCHTYLCRVVLGASNYISRETALI